MSTSRLSDEKREAIAKDLGSSKMTQHAIAKKHGVSQSTVTKINSGYQKSSQEAHDPTDTRILKLEAQVISLRDDNARCKQAYKAAQRNNSIFESLVDEMQTVVTPVKALPLKIRKKPGRLIQESVVAMLSDEHADTVVLPEQVGQLERYSFPIALRRAEEYVDTLIQYTQHTLDKFHFKKLYIFAIGDHTSGEIHGAKDHSEYRNQFRNCLAIGQMHALMFRDASQYFESIEIIYLSGNHGRRSVKKDYHGARDNWDYLIAEIARMHCVDLKNIHFVIPNSFSAGLVIEGWGFGLSHGDDIRGWNGIPWYGIERKTRRLGAISATRGQRIHYYGFAHFHNAATQAVLDGETIINGAWLATDPYAYEGLSVFAEPSQWLFGVHRKRGVSWRLNMKLRTEREHLGPNRYQISLAE